MRGRSIHPDSRDSKTKVIVSCLIAPDCCEYRVDRSSPNRALSHFSYPPRFSLTLTIARRESIRRGRADRSSLPNKIPSEARPSSAVSLSALSTSTSRSMRPAPPKRIVAINRSHCAPASDVKRWLRLSSQVRRRKCRSRNPVSVSRHSLRALWSGLTVVIPLSASGRDLRSRVTLIRFCLRVFC